MTDFDENMILPYVPCGHFALSTLSETCFKVSVFETDVKKYNNENGDPPPQKEVKCDTKIKRRIKFKYYFA